MQWDNEQGARTCTHCWSIDLDGASKTVILALALGHFALGAGVASLSASALLDEEGFEPEDSACVEGLVSVNILGGGTVYSMERHFGHLA